MRTCSKFCSKYQTPDQELISQTSLTYIVCLKYTKESSQTRSPFRGQLLRKNTIFRNWSSHLQCVKVFSAAEINYLGGVRECRF